MSRKSDREETQPLSTSTIDTKSLFKEIIILVDGIINSEIENEKRKCRMIKTFKQLASLPNTPNTKDQLVNYMIITLIHCLIAQIQKNKSEDKKRDLAKYQEKLTHLLFQIHNRKGKLKNYFELSILLPLSKYISYPKYAYKCASFTYNLLSHLYSQSKESEFSAVFTSFIYYFQSKTYLTLYDENLKQDLFFLNGAISNITKIEENLPKISFSPLTNSAFSHLIAYSFFLQGRDFEALNQEVKALQQLNKVKQEQGLPSHQLEKIILNTTSKSEIGLEIHCLITILLHKLKKKENVVLSNGKKAIPLIKKINRHPHKNRFNKLLISSFYEIFSSFYLTGKEKTNCHLDAGNFHFFISQGYWKDAMQHNKQHDEQLKLLEYSLFYYQKALYHFNAIYLENRSPRLLLPIARITLCLALIRDKQGEKMRYEEHFNEALKYYLFIINNLSILEAIENPHYHVSVLFDLSKCFCIHAMNSYRNRDYDRASSSYSEMEKMIKNILEIDDYQTYLFNETTQGNLDLMKKIAREHLNFIKSNPMETANKNMTKQQGENLSLKKIVSAVKGKVTWHNSPPSLLPPSFPSQQDSLCQHFQQESDNKNSIRNLPKPKFQ